MRLLIAGLAAVVAVAMAVPSYAQDENTPAATPTPAAKAKPGTAAYCQKQKTSSARTACLKKISAKSHKPTKTANATTAKKSKKTTPQPSAPKQPDVGQLAPPAAAPVPAANGTVAVPPLPQKTI
ncbi:hypothetical protein [Reyranella sp.]|uniref:hypothetical protein n=1 Tax=Reyranella sp. TaxID=1929291 RepID=UPI003BAA389A